MAPRSARRWPVWLTAAWLPASLALLAERGHLASAVVEWPVSTPRGWSHVVVAAVFGYITVAVYFGPSQVDSIVGVVAGGTVPLWWLIGSMLDEPLYLTYPAVAATATTVVEVGAAALLTLRWRLPRPS